jgi:hypothetical protein
MAVALATTEYDHSESILVTSPKRIGRGRCAAGGKIPPLVLDNQCVAGFVEPERSSISDTDG